MKWCGFICFLACFWGLAACGIGSLDSVKTNKNAKPNEKEKETQAELEAATEQERDKNFFAGKRFAYGLRKCKGLTYSDFTAALYFTTPDSVQLVYEKGDPTDKLLSKTYLGTFSVDDEELRVQFTQLIQKEMYFDWEGKPSSEVALGKSPIKQQYVLRINDCSANLPALESPELNKFVNGVSEKQGNWVAVSYRE